MKITSFAQWKQWSGSFSALPYIEKYELEGSENVVTWNKAWERASDCSFILESGDRGRYSYLGLRPLSTIQGKGYDATISWCDSEQTTRVIGSPLELVRNWMKPYEAPKVEGAPKFIGGCVGFWGYDVVRSIETLPVIAKDDLPFPDYCFMMMNEVWIIDHQDKRLYCAYHSLISDKSGQINEKDLQHAYEAAADRVAWMKKRWEQMIVPDPSEQHWVREAMQLIQQDRLDINIEEVSGIETKFKKSDFKDAVLKVQDYIKQGDVFQVNLSLRQSKVLNSKPEEIYEWLRLFNPSPYMGLLRFHGAHLVSASPELLVKLEGDRLSTRPIAGTRRRGKTQEEDRRMAAELMDNEKERAEHIMLLDLQRNDLGRISRYGTVKVKDFMVLEYYSHVMHLVSEVQGQLDGGKDAFDVMAATFPGGTITGAPKIRTMEIIEELEPVRRGPYTGSIGWIDYNGNMEFNIIIRTLTAFEGIGYIQAGAGIVIDSDPEREYGEALNKAKALWKAIQYSEL